jgi:hypothetical protein
MTGASEAPDPAADSNVLPAPAGWITLDYRMQHGAAGDPADEVEKWHVDAVVLDESGRPEMHVGELTLARIDLSLVDHPWSLLDGDSGELEHFGSVAFLGGEPGDLNPELEDLLESWDPYVLIITGVSLLPAWCGCGVGPMLITAMLQRMCAGVRVVLCYPAPILAGKVSDERYAQLQRRLRRMWTTLGFQPIPGQNDIYFMEPATTKLDELVADTRSRAEAAPARDPDLDPDPDVDV